MIRLPARFVADRCGIALIEFAYALPVLLVLGFGGAEVAKLAMTNTRVSQMTLTAADNASRVGEASTLAVRPLHESDINDVFTAADLQAPNLKIYQYGRLIMSSIQRNAQGGQFIAWQRCRGSKAAVSTYGVEGRGSTDTSFAGVGPAGSEIQAPVGGAVILVEGFYNYQPLTAYSGRMIARGPMKSVAVFTVRDQRDLSAVTNPENVAVSRCA